MYRYGFYLLASAFAGSLPKMAFAATIILPTGAISFQTDSTERDLHRTDANTTLATIVQSKRMSVRGGVPAIAPDKAGSDTLGHLVLGHDASSAVPFNQGAVTGAKASGARPRATETFEQLLLTSKDFDYQIWGVLRTARQSTFPPFP